MVPLIILLLVLVLVVFPLWAIIRIVSLGSKNDALERRLRMMDLELTRLHEGLRAPPKSPVTAMPVVAEPSPPTVLPPLPAETAPPVMTFAPPAAEPAPPPETGYVTATPPPLPPPAEPQIVRQPIPAATESVAVEPRAAPIDWEQFMGAKFFAWVGGFAAFLGVAFFVKYSFEHGWIPPELRVALGYLFAIGLVIGGLKIPRQRYAITAQTLCATGIVCLYGVTFACNSIYHFEFFGQVPTFVLMTLVTAAAFVLAVRLPAQVVAVLGILGGFLTPVLLSTGQDNPPGLFGYLALLDLGLIAVALHQRWHFLTALGAAGTMIMQVAWASQFLNAGKAPTAMVVCLGFCALFLGAYFLARRSVARTSEEDGSAPPQFVWPAVAFPFVALGFAAAFLGFDSVAGRPGLLFSFVLAADACLLVLAWWEHALPKLHLVAGIAVFGLLAVWTADRLTAELLPWALAFYLLHAVLHTAFPLWLERHRPTAAPTWWSQLFPPLALLLMLGPLFKLDSVSLVLWPCVLLVDLLAIFLAWTTASLAGIAIVLVLTLAATGVWLFRLPIALDAAPSLLLVIGAFAAVFFAAGAFLARRLGGQLNASEKAPRIFGDPRAQIPAASALLPFVLLIMMTQRLPFANPSPVFGLALLLVALTLGLTVVLAIEWLPACALAGVAALEYAWRARHFTETTATAPLLWYLGFYAVFAAFPFLFRRRFAALTGPWAVAALAGVLQFPLVYQLIARTHPNDFMGVLPALFALLPLGSLFVILRMATVDERARLNQVAWFGGVALFFITLIFPIQFERQWITLGWALEGVALLWLFQRVPHPALRATGVVLLVVAFARLALNKWVLAYHVRTSTPILNWYLYSYGVVTLALFVGAKLLAPPRERTLGIHAPALLNSLGTILAFLLLNIEIADYFAPSGARTLTFEFSGNFARDMTYTIAWALFALTLLLVSFWKQLRPGRYAALGLLGFALLKLFVHDLARLEALYRIGALMAVAAIATIASVAYQRFLPANDKAPQKP